MNTECKQEIPSLARHTGTEDAGKRVEDTRQLSGVFAWNQRGAGQPRRVNKHGDEAKWKYIRVAGSHRSRGTARALQLPGGVARRFQRDAGGKCVHAAAHHYC